MSNPTKPTGVTSSSHQTQVAGKTVSPTSVGSTNPLVVSGDMSIWDTVANKYVLVDQTLFGTTLIPKNQ